MNADIAGNRFLLSLPGLLAALFFFFYGIVTGAGTYFVSPDGDDKSSSYGDTLQTMAYACDRLRQGDTLVVLPGTYSSGGCELRDLFASTDAPTVVRGVDAGRVVVSGGNRHGLQVVHCEYIVVENIHFTGAARAGCAFLESRHCMVKNCIGSNNGDWGIFTAFVDFFTCVGNECYANIDEHGIYHSNSGACFLISDNLIYNNKSNGIHINGDPSNSSMDPANYPTTGLMQYGIVQNNVIYGNGSGGGAAINMTHTRDVLLRNNLIYDNKAGGVTFYHTHGDTSSQRGVFLNNTVVFNPGEGRNLINVQPESGPFIVLNNILVASFHRVCYEIYQVNIHRITADNNVFFGSNFIADYDDSSLDLADWRSTSGEDSSSVEADPEFLDRWNDEYHLGDKSPANAIGISLDSVKVILSNLNDNYSWIISQLDTLPDVDLEGFTHPPAGYRSAGAYVAGGRGDINEDGRISITDVLALLLLNRRNPNDSRCDFDYDGKFSIDDVIGLLQYHKKRIEHPALTGSSWNEW